MTDSGLHMIDGFVCWTWTLGNMFVPLPVGTGNSGQIGGGCTNLARVFRFPLVKALQNFQGRGVERFNNAVKPPRFQERPFPSVHRETAYRAFGARGFAWFDWRTYEYIRMEILQPDARLPK